MQQAPTIGTCSGAGAGTDQQTTTPNNGNDNLLVGATTFKYNFQKPKDETIPTCCLFITNLPSQKASSSSSSSSSLSKEEHFKIYQDWLYRELSENIENIETRIEAIVANEQKLNKKKKDKLEKKQMEGNISEHPTMQLYAVFESDDDSIKVKNYLLEKYKNMHISFAELAAESKEQRKKKHVKGWNVECTLSTDHVSIPGLYVIENFISEEEEAKIMEIVEPKTWFNELQRRVQHYGFKFDYDIRSIDFNTQVEPIPEYTVNIINRMKDTMKKKKEENDSVVMNDEFLSTFDFEAYNADQLTINEYQPGQGIRPHIDVHTPFNDGLFIVSLLSSSVMYFSRCVGEEVIEKKYVDLPRRSLIILVGEARFLWRHAIMCRELDRVNGKIRKRQRRVSLTIRSIRKEGLCTCKYTDVCDSQQNNEIAHNLPYSQQLGTTNLEIEYVQKTYNQIASHWDKTRHTPWPRVHEYIKGLADYTLIGDIGCGNGKYINLNPKCIWVATDRSEKLCEICVEKGYDVSISDALNLPYKSNTFDVTLNIAVLHHISSVARRIRLLKELVRVTRPGGEILIYAWSYEQETSSKRKFQSQDVFVPWKLQAKYLSGEDDQPSPSLVEENEVTIKRYCHVYRKGELDEMVTTKVKGVDIVDSYFDTGNWCLLLRKHTH